MNIRFGKVYLEKLDYNAPGRTSLNHTAVLAFDGPELEQAQGLNMLGSSGKLVYHQQHIDYDRIDDTVTWSDVRINDRKLADVTSPRNTLGPMQVGFLVDQLQAMPIAPKIKAALLAPLLPFAPKEPAAERTPEFPEGAQCTPPVNGWFGLMS